MSDKAYVCSECTATSAEPGDCPCGAGPRLDLGDPLAVEMLVEQDDRRAEKATQRNLWAGVAAGLGVVLLVLFVVPQVILVIPLPIPFANPIKIIALMILIAAGTSKGLDAALPAKPKFPHLRAAASAANPDLLRMRKTSRGTWIAIGVSVGILVLAGVVVTVGKQFAPDPNRSGASFGADGQDGAADREPPEAPPQLRDADFPVLSPGILSLRGMTSIGEGRTALLYRAPAGHLIACTVAPDNEAAVTCTGVGAGVRPQTARLVNGRDAIWIHGVQSMGETPEETVYAVVGVDGTLIETDLEKLEFASDRPQLPAPNATWLSTEFDGAPAKLTRQPSGKLEYTLGSFPTVFVMHDHDHGGPSTGQPTTFKGNHAAVILFQNKEGICALRVLGSGEVTPVGSSQH